MIKNTVATIGGSNPYDTGGELPEVHGAAHQHGGLDAIPTLDGMHGRLGDKQTADTLQAVVVSATPPEAGQILTATAADAAGWAAPSARIVETELDDGESFAPSLVGPGVLIVSAASPTPAWAIVYVSTAGAPTSIAKADAVALSDTDEKLCVYVDGSTFTIKNNLGNPAIVSVFAVCGSVLS